MSDADLNCLSICSVRKLADECGVSCASVISALEKVYEDLLSRRRYGDNKIKVTVDLNTGKVSAAHVLKIFEDIGSGQRSLELDEDGKEYGAILLKDALINDSNASAGDLVFQPIDSDVSPYQDELMRKFAAEVAALKRAKQHEHWSEKIGTIVRGAVIYVFKDGVNLDVAGTEMFLPMSYTNKGDFFRVEDRVKVLVLQVRDDDKRHSIIVSRSSPLFLIKLLEAEVPEIGKGIINVKLVARYPGERSKIAVDCTDPQIDPVGACIGVKGTRINAVSKELCMERIEVLRYSPDISTLIANAMHPVEVRRVIIDSLSKSATVIVPDEQLSMAIGKGGRQARLLSRLTGWEIAISGAVQDAELRNSHMTEKTQDLIELLDIDVAMAKALYLNGYREVEDIVTGGRSKMDGIDGLREEVADELFKRASEYCARLRTSDISLSAEAEDVTEVAHESLREFFSEDMSNRLIGEGINSLTEAADLSCDELCDILGTMISRQEAQDIIISMRSKLGYF